MTEKPESSLPVVAPRAEVSIPTPESRTPDLYEQQYMQGEGLVLHRAKEVSRSLNVILGAVGVFQIIVAIAAQTVVPVLFLPLLALLWSMFSVLRTTVSQGSVNVQYGLFGPKIPISAIEHAEATTYDWKKFGGWGIKRSLDGEWIYNMPGDGGRAVRIRWRDARGRQKTTLIGSKEPEAMAAAIAQARAALPAGAAPAALSAAASDDAAS